MTRLETLTRQVLDGQEITRQEALELYEQPLEELCQKADELRRYFCAGAPIRSAGTSAEPALICAPSSTAKAENARKTAGSAPSPPTTTPARQSTPSSPPKS